MCIRYLTVADAVIFDVVDVVVVNVMPWRTEANYQNVTVVDFVVIAVDVAAGVVADV